MNKSMSATNHAEVSSLLEFTARIGVDPLLTQASTGNTSMKLDNVLWIKASGRWMADAIHQNILIPLELAEVRQCVKQGVDPAKTRASYEQALALARAAGLKDQVRPLIELRLADLERLAEEPPPPAPPEA